MMELCACGGVIVAVEGADVVEAVRRHLMTIEHLIWRQASESFGRHAIGYEEMIPRGFLPPYDAKEGL